MRSPGVRFPPGVATLTGSSQIVFVPPKVSACQYSRFGLSSAWATHELGTESNGDEGPMAERMKTISSSVWLVVLFSIPGMFAVTEPTFERIGLLLGWLLIRGAFSHLLAAFTCDGARQGIWQTLIGVPYMMGGIYLLVWLIVIFIAVALFLRGLTQLISVAYAFSFSSGRRPQASLRAACKSCPVSAL